MRMEVTGTITARFDSGLVLDLYQGECFRQLDTAVRALRHEAALRWPQYVIHHDGKHVVVVRPSPLGAAFDSSVDFDAFVALSGDNASLILSELDRYWAEQWQLVE